MTPDSGYAIVCLEPPAGIMIAQIIHSISLKLYSQGECTHCIERIMKYSSHYFTKLFSIGLAILFLTACGSSRVKIPDVSELKGTKAGIQIVKNALNQLGRPYVFGGNSPAGFDCSGLVQYTHAQIGVNTPRVAAAQYQAAQPVEYSNLQAGDLVFFRLSNYKVNHVGIYMGQGFFIHSPAPGKTVSVKNLRHPFWREHMTGAGRYY